MGRKELDLTVQKTVESDTSEKTHFLWLEITGKCQRECEHCYAESSPKGTHGTMTEADWKRIIDEGAKAGVGMVQFIGGEPTLNTALPKLIQHALDRGVKVEVFSNLEHIKPHIWEVLSQEGISLATSYYSTDSAEHDSIVRRRGSYGRTKRNIAEAVMRGIPLRVGVIGVRKEQDVSRAVQELQELEVDEKLIGIDYLRQVGRGVRDQSPSMAQLCGNCANGVLAIMPDGNVQPCVFSRWSEMTVGNVREQSFGDVLEGNRLREVRSSLNTAFSQQQQAVPEEIMAWQPTSCPPVQPPCPPKCLPNCWPGCQPNCGPSCSPSCQPQGNCRPIVGPPY